MTSVKANPSVIWKTEGTGSFGSGSPKSVDPVIMAAKTPEDCGKLARYYRYEADKFKAEAAEDLTKAADQADQLAMAHEQMDKAVERARK